MNKRILVIGLTLALGGMSTAAFAGNAGDPGQFYIGAGVGQAKWDVDINPDSGFRLDDTDTTANVRFGYVWHWGVDFAVEGGYADLGEFETHYSDNNSSVHGSIENHGLFGGVKVKYGFARGWYVAGRGGLYQGKAEANSVSIYDDGITHAEDTFSSDETKTGWYAGVGIGYDLSRHFSLSVNYDYFHSEFADLDNNVDTDIGTVTVGVEYRF